MAKTIQEQVKSARRELALRHRVYGKLIDSGKMKADEVRHEIECMEAIVETLVWVDAMNGQKGLSL